VTRLTIIGDVLMDRDLDGHVERLAPDAPVPVVEGFDSLARPGGAGLAATLAARSAEVTLVCALAADDAGEELRALLEADGVRVIDLGLEGSTVEKIRVLAEGRPVVRLDRGAGVRVGPLPAGALDGADAVLVSDYGRGVAAEPSVRAALEALRVPLVWDPHPKGPEPVSGATLVTPNEREAAQRAGEDAAGDAGAAPSADRDAELAARALRSRWGAVAVAVTLGARGALLVGGDGLPLRIPARPAAGDPCGAGDAFAVAAALGLAAGALPTEAVCGAVEAASAYVSGEVPAVSAAEAVELAERVRRSGGTVVATGGCFDLLHAGHVRMLEQARALGDCLIVCLNSDESVRRLKGDDRPLVEQHDRAAVLRALACVDAVAVFEEDEPSAILRTLRPHIWAKGGDYAVSDLPEAKVLAEWGGRPTLVPYVAGRSTTRLITEVLARAR
jgi:rfaE bifunctional protein nucleotidyltransferase chain/domain/rfaE bifunctional protein kinase chain/domain